jgi:hypothetical protein
MADPRPLKISGFSFVRNAIKFDYPVVESLKSVLPLCDEIVVAVGRSEDDTLDLVRSVGSPKIRIVETVWDESLRQGGRVLAVETDKALRAISPDTTWAVYIQADEVLHEDGLPALREAMERWRDDPRVQGLLVDFRHFYGSYDYLAAALAWYRREIRVVRNDPAVFSYRDAQGFRRRPSEKLRVKHVPAFWHHYGAVRHPRAMAARTVNSRYWFDDAWIAAHPPLTEEYVYEGKEPIRRFEATHPAVMRPRIAAMGWRFSGNPEDVPLRMKDRLRLAVQRATGWRPGEYRNYRIV